MPYIEGLSDSFIFRNYIDILKYLRDVKFPILESVPYKDMPNFDGGHIWGYKFTSTNTIRVFYTERNGTTMRHYDFDIHVPNASMLVSCEYELAKKVNSLFDMRYGTSRYNESKVLICVTYLAWEVDGVILLSKDLSDQDDIWIHAWDHTQQTIDNFADIPFEQPLVIVPS